MVYLCGRPLPNRGRCTLGRETAIQPMTWGADGWLRTTTGEGIPIAGRAGARRSARSPFPAASGARGLRRRRRCRSTSSGCDRRGPTSCSASRARPGHLRLYGRETIGSLFTQALVARRQQAHCYSASTIVEFEPRALPADGRPGLLLQQHASSTTSTSRTTRRSASTCASCRRCRTQVTADAFTPPIADCRRRADRTARRGGLRAAAFRVSRRRRGRGSGCRSSSTPASSPTKPPRRGCRTSPARSSAWRARTCGHGAAGGLRLVRVPRAGLRGGRHLGKQALRQRPRKCDDLFALDHGPRRGDVRCRRICV